MKSVVIIEFCLTGKDFLKMEKKLMYLDIIQLFPKFKFGICIYNKSSTTPVQF